MILTEERKIELLSDNNYMLDFETLDTTSSACVIGVACVRFVPLSGKIIEKFSSKINLQSCLDLGGTISQDTLKWWLEREKESFDYFKDAICANHPHIGSVFANLRGFMHKIGQDKPLMWCNGASFDFPLIIHWFNKVNLDHKWYSHGNENDCRTYFSMNKEYRKRNTMETVKHDPLPDCLFQIHVVGEILRDIYGVTQEGQKV